MKQKHIKHFEMSVELTRIVTATDCDPKNPPTVFRPAIYWKQHAHESLDALLRHTRQYPSGILARVRDNPLQVFYIIKADYEKAQPGRLWRRIIGLAHWTMPSRFAAQVSIISALRDNARLGWCPNKLTALDFNYTADRIIYAQHLLGERNPNYKGERSWSDCLLTRYPGV